ncbi:TcpD family membrane protein [Enterococcus faecalis]|uniref:TcpD family membrane protein n=1 Tax=Enterococcus faecalis TaxID=1351 RepID=UPI001E2C6C95|nr:TcpD family membrane protein [Enterococcus faecalis]MCD4978454.1 hypothetical protein [Enterococcus faecalis]
MMNLKFMAQKAFVLASTADLPSAKPFQKWMQGEVGSLIVIALVVLCGIAAFKRDTTKAILSLVACGAFYVFVKNPDGTILVWMQALTDLISGK